MPREMSDLDGIAPVEPHLGVIVDRSGRIVGLPPGTTIMIIENPAKLDQIFPLTLLNVSHKKLDFKCHCNNPECTRRVSFKAAWTGRHPLQYK